MKARPVNTESQHAGLDDKEATARLIRYGRNELPAAKKRSLLRIARDVLTEPMFLLLLLAAILYLTLGDLSEGILLCMFAILTISMVIVQERRSDHAIDKLKALGSPTTVVIRNSRTQRITSAEVVPGDLLVLDEGERIAADALLLKSDNLNIDESLLTGESLPVAKNPGKANADPAESDETGYVYSGTLVTRGSGIAEVVATGVHTRFGSIGVSLASIEIETTRLQKNTGKIVRLFGINAAIISLGLVFFYGFARDDWMQGILSGIALSMAMLPEEFPIALSIIFAMGAWRLAKIKVLARRSAVIETLGAATVLCVDKTGTLTENKMRVRHLYANGQMLALHGEETQIAEHFHRLLEYGKLATRHRSFDPMDTAVSHLAQSTLQDTEHMHTDWPLHREYGLTRELLAMSQVWQSADATFEIASKGAPEAIADLCHLSDLQTKDLMQQVSHMAADGLRILAVAKGRHDNKTLPENQHDFDFELLGLMGFEDPLRPTVAKAVVEATEAGIKIKMLTGDYAVTANAIAKQAGLNTRAATLSGNELDTMDDAALQKTVSHTDIYARIKPEQKLRLVQALKATGEVVAMTGDGVNDAAALKAAHIGIAMGQSGTDVAREAAAIVLLEEDFGRIVDAIRLGRRIFDNLRKVMLYIVAVHVPIAGLAIIPLLLGWPAMLMPAHVVMIEMIIDPMCTFAFENEPEEKDIMQLPPRLLSETLIGVPQLFFGLIQGGILLLACLFVYQRTLLDGQHENIARTLAFISLTAGNLMMIRIIASRHFAFRHFYHSQHKIYWLISTIAVVIVSTAIMLPWLRAAFDFALPGLGDIFIAIVLGLLAGAVLDLAKWHPWVQRTLGGRIKPANRNKDRDTAALK
jgi:P-type Ca2+ transporter type 2C